jgi:outer membrane protein assembly factor BamB
MPSNEQMTVGRLTRIRRLNDKNTWGGFMRQRLFMGCLLALTATLTACGGGGGGGSSDPGDSGPGAYRLSFAPGTLTATFEQGKPPPTVSVTATVDTVGVIEPTVQLTPGAGNSYQAAVTPKASLPSGEYTGALQIRLCFDNPATCTSPMPGSPFSLPYKFTVTMPPVPPAAVISSPALKVDAYQDEVPTINLSADLAPGVVFPQIIDKTGVFQPNPPKSVNGSSLNASLFLNTSLSAGTYTGNVELHVCKDLPCTQEVAGSPVLVPYNVTLRAATNLSTLVRASGVGEWAQHQADAAHTGYSAMTLDPTKFNRRWRWTLPLSNAGGLNINMQPVVTSNGTVYVQTSGYFQSATLFALSEHDKSVRWKKDFGSVFAANPPSTDAGMVYLATSGHQDTFMWAFDGASGALNFRTAFSSQWEHYMAPAITNGAVYTNGGSYGGMLSFRLSDGQQNWFTGLSQYDQWTPAVDARYAYAFMPDGLNAVNVATGAIDFVITDPNNGVQAYSVNGAPMLIGPGNVVVVNGPGYNGAVNRLVNFDTASRTVKWSIPGAFSMAPAFAKNVVYVVNGAQLEARNAADGSRLWGWVPDEASVDPFRNEYGQLSRNIVVTDNLAFVSSASKVYAVNLATHQTVWTFPKPGRLALSPNGVLYINVPALGDEAASLYAINVN